MQSLHRTGDATLAMDGSKYIIKAKLGLNEVDVDYTVHAQYLFVHTGGSIQAKAINLDLVMEVDACPDSSCPTTTPVLTIGNVTYKVEVAGGSRC